MWTEFLSFLINQNAYFVELLGGFDEPNRYHPKLGNIWLLLSAEITVPQWNQANLLT